MQVKILPAGETIKEKQMFKCPKCETSLIRGREHTFPPRLFYWYCPRCQEIYEEKTKKSKCIYPQLIGVLQKLSPPVPDFDIFHNPPQTQYSSVIEYVGKVKGHETDCILNIAAMGFVQNIGHPEKYYPDSVDQKSMDECSERTYPEGPGDLLKRS